VQTRYTNQNWKHKGALQGEKFTDNKEGYIQWETKVAKRIRTRYRNRR